jgi:hypothetical protein
MSRVQTKQTLKLHLLAFVLALTLVWYSPDKTLYAPSSAPEKIFML